MSTHDATTAPRRRSVHFVPGGNEKFFGRALTSGADTLVLDLEDSVPPDRKPAARQAVAEWLGDERTSGQELMVRVNATDTPWFADDVRAVAGLAPDSLMVPKVASVADLERVDEVLAPDDPHAAIALFPVATEVALGVINLPTLGTHHRVDGLCWGAEDLSAELGASTARDTNGQLLPVFVTVQSWCLLGAASAGVGAVDAVFTDLADHEGLRCEARAAAAMGFAGKITIHPDQIEIVNEAFTPTAEAVEHAAALVAAAELNEREGRMAFDFRGQMVDAPHITRARRLLHQAAASTGGHDGADT